MTVGSWEAAVRALLVMVASLEAYAGGSLRGVAFSSAVLAVMAFYTAFLLILAVLNKSLSRLTIASLDLLLVSLFSGPLWSSWFPALLFVGASAEVGVVLPPFAGLLSLALGLSLQGLVAWWAGTLEPLWALLALTAVGTFAGGRVVGGAVRRLRAQLDALREISAAVASIPRIEEALSQIVLSSGLILEAEKCVILLREEGSGELVAQQPVLGLTEEEVRRARFKPRGLLAEVLEGGKPIKAEAKALSGPDAELAERLGARALILAPLQVENRTLGVIAVANKLRGGVFSSEDARLLGMLAAHAAMIIENARLHARVEEERSRLQAVMASMPSGVLFLDGEGRVVLANPLVERFLRKRLSEVVGRRVEEAIDHPRLRETLTKPAEGGELREEVSFQPERDLVLEVRATDVRSPDGRVLGRVAVLHDITELKRVDQMKSEFVSTVSHELRTPLTSIKAFTATLLRRPQLDEPTRREFLEIIDSQCDRLARLINDLLSISRIESGRALEMRWKWVDLGEVIRRVVKAHEPHARKHHFVVEIPEGLPKVAADEDKVEQILTNLVSNAVKYSPDGGPVEIRVIEREDEIEVSVTDHGIGIPEDKLERIFDKFYQVDSSTRRKVGGAGLGLYLTKHLVHAHGGRIWAESKVGEGSTFYFTIPKREKLPEESKYKPGQKGHSP